MTAQENATSPGTDVSPQPSGNDPAQTLTNAGNNLDEAARKMEKLISSFSQPASRVTGRIISLLGMALVVTTFILGIVHLLGSVDFVASIVSGAILTIAGIAMITTDDARAQRAVAALLDTPTADSFKRDMAARWPPAQ